MSSNVDQCNFAAAAPGSLLGGGHHACAPPPAAPRKCPLCLPRFHAPLRVICRLRWRFAASSHGIRNHSKGAPTPARPRLAHGTARLRCGTQSLVATLPWCHIAVFGATAHPCTHLPFASARVRFPARCTLRRSRHSTSHREPAKKRSTRGGGPAAPAAPAVPAAARSDGSEARPQEAAAPPSAQSASGSAAAAGLGLGDGASAVGIFALPTPVAAPVGRSQHRSADPCSPDGLTDESDPGPCPYLDNPWLSSTEFDFRAPLTAAPGVASAPSLGLPSWGLTPWWPSCGGATYPREAACGFGAGPPPPPPRPSVAVVRFNTVRCPPSGRPLASSVRPAD